MALLWKMIFCYKILLFTADVKNKKKSFWLFVDFYVFLGKLISFDRSFLAKDPLSSISRRIRESSRSLSRRGSAAGRTFSRPVRRTIVPIPLIGREPAGTACPQEDSLFRFSFVPTRATATRRDGTRRTARWRRQQRAARRVANLHGECSRRSFGRRAGCNYRGTNRSPSNLIARCHRFNVRVACVRACWLPYSILHRAPRGSRESAFNAKGRVLWQWLTL